MATQDFSSEFCLSQGREEDEVADTESFLFLPQWNKRWCRISLFLQKKVSPSLLSAKQASEWSKEGELINPLYLYCKTQCCDILHLWVTEWERVPASSRKSGLRIPLEQEALVWHITHCVVVLQESGIYASAWASSCVGVRVVSCL